MKNIHTFHHRAMATYFEARIAHQERAYAAQAAQAAFDLLDKLEARLSRFRANSEIAQIVALAPSETLRLSESVFACLEVAKKMELATLCAFSVTAAALQTQVFPPQWHLIPQASSIQCDSGRLHFDLGAIGKGFALDRMGALLRDWNCDAFLLVAGGSSVLAGDAPPDSAGWSCGLGDDNAQQRLLLTRASLSGSGVAVKGSHILDPRSGLSAVRQNRVWALADSAAESDALSTACMVLNEPELHQIVANQPSWLFLIEANEIDAPQGISARVRVIVSKEHPKGLRDILQFTHS